MSDIMFSTGKYDSVNKEFIVENPSQLKPQDNFLFNDRVFAYVTHTGNGYFVYDDENDYTTDGIRSGQYGRVIYVRDNDSKKIWSIGWEPILRDYEHFEARIGLNYTKIINMTDGIKCEWTILVPKAEKPVELWNVKFSAETQRKISVFFYSEITVLSSYPTYGDFFYCHCDMQADNAIHLVSNAPALRDKINSVTCYVTEKPDHYTGCKNDFLGGYRGFQNPFFAEEGNLPDTFGSNENYCAGFQWNYALEPGSEKTIGQAVIFHNHSESPQPYYASAAAFDKEMAETAAQISEQFAGYNIETGDSSLDMRLNVWCKQMNAFGAIHCRWGCKGFRDIVQHCLGQLYLSPGKVKDILIKCLKHQFSSGFAVRSFPLIHEDSSMKYNDSATWLVFAITEYVKETGDFSFLKEKITFFDGGESSVEDRLRLIVKSVFNDRGERGLVRMRSGDWNDSFTQVGILGKGESVWLTMFLLTAVKLVRELECYLGNNTESYDGMIAQLKEALDKNTWDGNWFIRAIDDYGDKIGSHSSKEGKIFLNAQAWALIAGVASEEKKSEIIKSVQKYLKTDYGYTLNYPEYTEYDPRIGRLSSIEPGTLENASVYIHGNAFWIMGLLLAGENDLAYQTMQLIDPANPALAGKPSVPYVYANCYYGPSYEKCPGKMEHSWITGSVNWIMLAVIDFMFGVRRNYDGLHIAPSLPAEIKNAGIVRKFRDCEYTINVINNGKNITALYVNGEQADKDKALPYKAGGKYEVRVITG